MENHLNSRWGGASLDAALRRKLLRAYDEHYNPTLAVMMEVMDRSLEVRGRGTRLFDETGREHLDFSAGYGVFALGQGHPRVRATALDQLSSLAMAPSGLLHAPRAKLVERLAELLPGDLNRVWLVTTGSEAIEVALHIAMSRHPRRRRIVAARNSYHGKTLGALGVTGQPHLQAHFLPLWQDMSFVPYGDVSAMESAIGQDVSCVLLEPVLGGGYITVPPDGYLSEVRRICDRTGTLLIADEVQTGFGRTGAMFGVDHDGVVPDLIILSKAITGGHTAMAACVARQSVVEGIAEGSLAYQTDSGGSPLACAVANTALDVLLQERLHERAAKLGPYLIQGLRTAAQNHPRLVLDVPGRGLMTGVMLRNPALEIAVWFAMGQRGVITGYSTNDQTRHPVLRFYPALNVESSEIDRAVGAFEEVLQQLDRFPARATDWINRAMKLQFHVPKSWIQGMYRAVAARRGTKRVSPSATAGCAAELDGMPERAGARRAALTRCEPRSAEQTD